MSTVVDISVLRADDGLLVTFVFPCYDCECFNKINQSRILRSCLCVWARGGRGNKIPQVLKQHNQAKNQHLFLTP